MALPLLTGDQREDQAIATGAAVAAILTSAELALAAAISAAVWKTALGHPPSRRSLERTIAVILAVAELKAERAAALGGTVPEAVTKAITAATERAYAEAVAAYEQAVAAAGSEGGVASLPRILAAQKTLDDLLGKGLTGYVDRAGRNWDLATYAEMATRTGISNAIDARLARALEAEGLDLVLVTHGSEPACPKCRPYLDHLLSLTGQTPPGISEVEDSTGRFRTAEVVATVQSAMAHGWRHPNCRCGMQPWSDGADFSASDSFVPPSPEAMERRYAAEQARRAAQRRLRDAQRGQRLAMTPRARSHAARDVAAAQEALAHHRTRRHAR